MLTTIKGDISNNTIIVGDFNSPLIPTDRSCRQKSSLGEFKKTQIVSSFFSDHKAVRLGINYRKQAVENTNTQRLDTKLLSNQEVTEEVNASKQMTTKTWPLWGAVKAALSRKFTAKQAYLKKWEKHWINNLTLHLTQLEKEENLQEETKCILIF